ncbi:MAG: MATE family efflux transporter [Pyrinomonadaceae bacterium]
MTESTELEAEAAEAGGPAAPPKPHYDRSIVEGPLGRAVWKIAWPTMLTNVIAGLQGMIDHALVGNLVGYKANAAIGISFQIFLTVVVFISSIFIGMSIHVARFVGAGDKARVDRTVYQAFLTAIFISVGIMAPVGYFAAPYLLDFVSPDAGVKAEALPFLRVTFVFSFGILIYFMTSGALRAAGDAKTGMRLGIAMTVLNLILNIVLISGLGPIPAFGTVGSAMGSSIAAGTVGLYAIYKLWSGGWVVHFPRGQGWGPDWKLIRSLFKFGLPAGIQGIAMNIGGLLMLYFIGTLENSAAAQAAYALAYGQLFLLVTWSSNGLMGASAAVAGQNLGAKQPDRAFSAVNTAARFGLAGATFLGIFYFFFPAQLLAVFGMTDPTAVDIGVQLLRVLAFSGLFIAVALTYTGGLQGTGDTKSPLYISIISQVVVPLGICFVIKQVSHLGPIHIWLAILAGHMTRCGLSVFRFLQGKWRSIKVEIETTAA